MTDSLMKMLVCKGEGYVTKHKDGTRTYFTFSNEDQVNGTDSGNG